MSKFDQSGGEFLIKPNDESSFIDISDVKKRSYITAGLVTVPAWTDLGTGRASLTPSTVRLYSDAAGLSNLEQYDISGGQVDFLDNTESYVVADYNGGLPLPTVITDGSLINGTTVVGMYTVFRRGTDLRFVFWGLAGIGLSNKAMNRLAAISKFQRESGLELGESGAGIFSVYPGYIWHGANRLYLDNCFSSTDAIVLWQHVAGVWTTSSVTTFNNSQYDNGTALATLSDGNYAVNYVYRLVSALTKRVAIVLGTADYTLNQAQAARPPVALPYIPADLMDEYVYAGRYIVKKGDSTSTEKDSAFELNCTRNAAADHDTLIRSVGGAVGDRQHITTAQVAKLDDMPLPLLEDLTMYVDGDAGDDADDGLTWGTAKKTLGFLYSGDPNALPCELNATVTVLVRGTVLSANDQYHTIISGFHGKGKLIIEGQTTDVETALTPTLWDNDTLTSVAATSFLEVTGAGWTVDEHQGNFIQFTTSPAATTLYPIQSNTATRLETIDIPSTISASTRFKIVSVPKLRGAQVSAPLTLITSYPASQFPLSYVIVIGNLLPVNVSKFSMLEHATEFGSPQTFGGPMEHRDDLTWSDSQLVVSNVVVDYDPAVFSSNLVLNRSLTLLSDDSHGWFAYGQTYVRLTGCCFLTTTVASKGSSFQGQEQTLILDYFCRHTNVVNAYYLTGSSLTFYGTFFEKCTSVYSNNGLINYNGSSAYAPAKFKDCVECLRLISTRMTVPYTNPAFLTSGCTREIVLADDHAGNYVTATFADLAAHKNISNAANSASVTYKDGFYGIPYSLPEYDNTASGLTATSYQGAIDEVVQDKPWSRSGTVLSPTTAGDSIAVEFAQFDAAPTGLGAYAEGKLFYDATWRTLSAQIGRDVTLQIGQEDLRRVYNNTGVTLYNGQAVYVTGVYSGGSNDVVTVALAKADADATAFVIGCLTQNIPNNDYGFVTVRGNVNDLDTNRIGSAYLNTQGMSMDGLVGGTAGNAYTFTVVNTGSGGLTYTEVGGAIIVDLGGATPTRAQLATLVNTTTPSAYVRIFVETAGNVIVASVLPFAGGVATAAGDVLYLSAAVPGKLRVGVPDAPNLEVRVGRIIIKSATVGRVNVRIYQAYRLGDLTDVATLAVAVDDTLKWNGSSWVNGPPVSSSASAGIEWWPDTTNIINKTTENDFVVETLGKTPVTTAESVEAIACTNNTVIGSAYLYNTALGRTTLEGGAWSFDAYCSVSSTLAGRISSVTFNMYTVRPYTSPTVTITGSGTARTCIASSGTPFATDKIVASATSTLASFVYTPKGMYQITARTSDTEVTIATPTGYGNESTVAFSVWKRFGGVNTGTITSLTTAYGLYSKSFASGAVTIEVTDKLGMVVFGTSNNTTTVNYVYNGTANYSHLSSPLVTLHNNLAGLNAAGGNYQHLTDAQLSGLTGGTSTTLHIHDGRYYTETELGSATGGSEGALLIGTDVKTSLDGATTVEAALTALATTNAHRSIVVNGDSISWPFSTTWPYRMAIKSPLFSRGTFTNYSVGGKTAATIAGEYSSTTHNQRPVQPGDEAWFFLFAGTNDIYADTTGAATYAHLQTSWAAARAEGFKVCAFTVMDSTRNSAGQRAQLVILNNLIKGTPSLYDYLVRADLVLPNPASGTYFADGIHPTAAGDELIASAVAVALDGYRPYAVVHTGPEVSGNAYHDLILNPQGRAVAIGTVDPTTTAKLTVQGTTADASTSIIALRDSGGVVVASVDTDGKYYTAGSGILGGAVNATTLAIGWIGAPWTTGIYWLTANSPWPVPTAMLDDATLSLYVGTNYVGATALDRGRVTAQGGTNNGTTRLFVGRDSDGATVFGVDTDGNITASGTLGATAARISKGWFADLESTAGIILGLDAATNTAGFVKLWGAGANNFSTTFTAGTQTADATYTLPTAMPASTMVLQSTSAGVMSWTGAPTATAITVAAEAADQTCYPLFVTNNIGDLAPKTHSLWGFDALNCFMGLGTAVPTSRLHVVGTYTNAYGTTSQLFLDTTLTTNGSLYNVGQLIDCSTTNITAGVTDSGYKTCVQITNTPKGAGFAGTQTLALGLLAYSGIGALATAGAAITNVYGAQFINYNLTAGTTVTNSYGVYVDSRYSSVGTITNAWDVYAANVLARNYFAGKVGIGIDSPSLSTLHILKKTADMSLPALLITGMSSGGVEVLNQGFGLYLTYNAAGNHQMVFAETETGKGVRYIGHGIDGCTTAGARADLNLGTDTNGAHVGTAVGATQFSVSNLNGTASKVVCEIKGAAAQSGNYLNITTDQYTHPGEILQITSAGDMFLGTYDVDGTPAIGRLVVRGASNDGNTNIFVGRDSDDANQFVLNTDGQITTGSWHATTIAYDHGGTGLTAYPTKTIILPAAAAALGTTTPATRETREIGATARPVVDVLKFPHASIAFAWWSFILPDSYNGGTITAKISYTNIATDSTNKFLFTISAACLADGGPLDATMGTAVELEATVADTAEDIKIASWGTAITPSGSPAGGQVIIIKLQRDPADTTHDTTSLDAYVKDLAIEYTTNSWTD